ncbi:MAG: histidinol-phosphatase [Parvibaculaceae bacterium]|nr:histidinol-phosphatase [Parvibaculaceae bacterium]
MTRLSERDIDELAAFAEELAAAAATVTLPHFRTGIAVEEKTGHFTSFDPVTEADRGSEALMRQIIGERYPDHGVLGEEHGRKQGSSPLTWVLDPIDGTRSFIAGIPLWGTLIGLNDGVRPTVGVMAQPYLGELFVGRPGRAELVRAGERRRLTSSKVTQLGNAILACTDTAMFTSEGERAAFNTLTSRTRLRRLGGDCYFYSMLAAGGIDLVVECKLEPYDIQALIPIIEGAGGIVTSWSGGDCQNGGQIVAAATPELHAAALDILKDAAAS